MSAAVSLVEMVLWLNAHRALDQNGKPRVRRFEASLAEAFGEREFSAPARDALYVRFPWTMAALEGAS